MSSQAAAIDVAWLDRVDLVAPPPTEARVLAAWLTARAVHRTDPGGPFGADGWRLAAPRHRCSSSSIRCSAVDLVSGRVVGPDGEWSMVAESAGTPGTRLTLDGQETEAVLLDAGHRVEISHRGQRFVFARPDVFADHGPATGDGTVASPMPSVVVEVRVGPGEAVVADQVLGIVEAMKMEVAVRAPFARHRHRRPGQAG